MSNTKALSYTYAMKYGEMLDEVVYRHYGTHQHLQLVLNANPDLARLGPVVPPGISITLPPAPVDEKKYITLWG